MSQFVCAGRCRGPGRVAGPCKSAADSADEDRHFRRNRSQKGTGCAWTHAESPGAAGRTRDSTAEVRGSRGDTHGGRPCACRRLRGAHGPAPGPDAGGGAEALVLKRGPQGAGCRLRVAGQRRPGSERRGFVGEAEWGWW